MKFMLLLFGKERIQFGVLRSTIFITIFIVRYSIFRVDLRYADTLSKFI